MKPELTGRWITGVAGVALLAFAAIAPGCGRPQDEAWLRFLGFSATAASHSSGTSSSTTSSTSMTTTLEGELRDGNALTAYANFENPSQNVGQTTGGTGVLVYRVRVNYRMAGYSPPSAEYSANLYLTPPTSTTATEGAMTVALVPISLKQWLIDTGAFNDAAAKPVVELTAQVTFFGKTDAGAKIEAEGSIGIALTNTGATTNTTNTTVSVDFKANATIGGADGGFIVSRNGSTAAELEVEFTTAGSAETASDYYSIGTSVLIPAGSKSTTITVIARSGGTSGRMVIINLSTSTLYAVGSPASASLLIQ